MNDSWSIAHQGKGYGPFSLEQLRALAALEVLRPTDRVWRDGESDSDFAATVDGLWTTGSVPGTDPPQQDAVPKVVWLLGIGIWIVAAAMACYALSGRMLSSSLAGLHMVPNPVATSGQQGQKGATVDLHEPENSETAEADPQTDGDDGQKENMP